MAPKTPAARLSVDRVRNTPAKRVRRLSVDRVRNTHDKRPRSVRRVSDTLDKRSTSASASALSHALASSSASAASSAASVVHPHVAKIPDFTPYMPRPFFRSHGRMRRQLIQLREEVVELLAAGAVHVEELYPLVESGAIDAEEIMPFLASAQVDILSAAELEDDIGLRAPPLTGYCIPSHSHSLSLSLSLSPMWY